ncbi:MAG: amidohydrolase family protein [Chloroflexota bacterium]
MTAQTYLADRVFDGAGTTIDKGFVTVEDGKISAVGAASELGSAGDGAIDFGDATLLPGLVNCHTHLTFTADGDVLGAALNDSYDLKVMRAVENARKALFSGVTTIRDCGTLNSIAFAIREASAAGVIASPHVWASGNVLTSTGGHCYFFGVECDTIDDVRKAVRSQVKSGADFIKVMATGGGLTPNTFPAHPQFTREQMVALADDSRRLDKRISAHCHGTPGIENAVAAEVTTIEHCSFMTPDDIVYDQAVANSIAEKGIYVCPTLSVGERARQRAREEGYEIPDRFRRMREARVDNLRRLRDTGVEFISGSDAGVTYTAFDDFQLDIEMLVEFIGVPNDEAIITATGKAAEAIGSDEFGVLAEGKRADVIAVAGNPLHDISKLRDLQMVMKSGTVYVDNRN